MAGETEFMRRCMKRATALGARLFRMNVGLAWVGDVRRNRDGSITIRNPRPFRAGVAGMSDLVGWVPVEITADMVGQTVAVFAAVETKAAKGRASDEQRKYVAAVAAAGGRAGVARSDDDLTMILCPDRNGAQGVVKNAT